MVDMRNPPKGSPCLSPQRFALNCDDHQDAREITLGYHGYAGRESFL